MGLAGVNPEVHTFLSCFHFLCYRLRYGVLHCLARYAERGAIIPSLSEGPFALTWSITFYSAFAKRLKPCYRIPFTTDVGYLTCNPHIDRRTRLKVGFSPTSGFFILAPYEFRCVREFPCYLRASTQNGLLENP